MLEHPDRDARSQRARELLVVSAPSTYSMERTAVKQMTPCAYAARVR